MKLIHSLSLDGKLEVMDKLAMEIKPDLPSTGNSKYTKEDLIDKLYGAWKDMDEGVFDDIICSRTISDREINLDA